MVVGLTGGIGSGKSTILNFFSKLDGVVVYMADKEAKKLMNTSDEIKNKLIEKFGSDVYTSEGLNRAYLANIVFENKEKLLELTQIVHPVVRKHFLKFVAENTSEKGYIVYENAILFENLGDAFCDVVVTVTAPENIRIERVMKRDNVTKEAVKNRIDNQWSETKKIIQSHYVIDNILLEDSEKSILEIHQKLTERFR